MSQFDGAPVNAGNKNYESMDIVSIEMDKVAGPVLQRKALEYFLNDEEGKQYFSKLEFEGEINSEGFLKLKSGEFSDTKPSRLLGNKAMKEVVANTKKALKLLEGLSSN